MFNKINIIFVPTNMKSLKQPMEQGMILTSSHYLINTFCKVIAAHCSDVSGQRKLKTFCKGFIFLEAIKKGYELWEVKISTEVWEKLIITFVGDFDRLATSGEEVITDVETAREVKLEVEPETRE
jgi:hypothetical protein